MALVLSAGVWAAGLAFMCVELHGDAVDAFARYERVELPQGRRSPAATHIALAGQALATKVVVKETKPKNASVSGTDFFMVPIAPRGWQAGQPVRYVAKLVYEEELDELLRQADSRDSVVLGRLVGGVPDRAAAALAGMSVPLEPDAQVVQWIPSRNGLPAIRDKLALYWSRTWIACLILSLLVTAFTLLRGAAVIHMKPGVGG